jgi:uncharacterized protein (DUF302 family)
MKGITSFIFGLIVGVALTVVVLIFVLPGQMFVVHESNKNFDETIQAIEQSAVENNWSIPHQYNLQATMNKHGFEVQPVKVISLCKPEHAYEILGSENERLVSALMPCRVAVYEKNGKTYVSMLNSGLFSKFMGEKVSDVMGAATKENLQILEPVIN